VRRAALAAAGLALALTGCAAGQLAQTAYENSTVDGATGGVGTILLRDITIAFPDSGRYVKGDSAQLKLNIVNNGDQDDQLTDVRTGVATSVLVSSKAVTAPGASDTALPSGTGTPTITAPPTDTVAPSATFTPSVSVGQSSPDTATPPGTGTPTGTGTGTGTASSTETPTPAATTATTTATPTPTPTPTASASAPATSVPVTIPAEGLVTFGTEQGASVLLQGLTEELLSTETVQVTFVFAKAGEVTITVPVGTPSTPLPPPSTIDGVVGGEPTD
jgi:copper(I)-binding protein